MTENRFVRHFKLATYVLAYNNFRFVSRPHELAEALQFAPEDGGSAEYPNRYVAAEGAAPVISAGRRVTGCRETTHNNLRCWVAKLPEVAADPLRHLFML